MIRCTFFSFLLFVAALLPMWADAPVRVSILTCSPGVEAYSLYGHTAIRCQAPRSLFLSEEERNAMEQAGTGAEESDPALDVVFNYGVFSFDQPHFIWRFVLGRCDYMVQPIPWYYFEREYRQRGSSVTEQELNLTEAEARRLVSSLAWNARPENCQYRYNFLSNNCTTRVMEMVEQAVDDSVVFAPSHEVLTHRQMLHRYNGAEAWSQEGCDLLLGADTDTLLSERASMFLPEYMMHYADGAVLRDSMNNCRPLVRDTRIVVPLGNAHPEPLLPLSPSLAAWLLVALFILIMAVEYALHCQLWPLDVAMLLLQGLVGCLLLFMMFVSQHPGVHQNWLILLFHPLAFVGLYLVPRAALQHRPTRWHACNFTILLAFLVFSPWIPQDFGNIIVPLALVLLTRSASYLLFYSKEQKNGQRATAKNAERSVQKKSKK